ncbi:MAG: translation factor Sua5, partial [Pedobacter sp.]
MLKQEIEKALTILKNGGVILYPTDTVWGLGCDATNEAAVARINKIKGRAEDKSFIILLDT